MKKIQVISIILVSLVLTACGNTQRNNCEKQSKAAEINYLALIDSLEVGEPFRLCKQVLTSADGILAAFPDSCVQYEVEMTPVKYSFFVPEGDIKPSEIVTNITTRYNMISVANRVLHGLEWFERASSEAWDTLPSKSDTLDLVKKAQPGISMSLLSEVLKDEKARRNAQKYLEAFRTSDGNIDEGSTFHHAYIEYKNVINEYPMIASDGMRGNFETEFWDWYDKANYVPGIDDVIRMHLRGAPKYDISDDQLAHFRDAVISEKDIDRRTILALEYVKNDEYSGSVLLGEILESGIYTRYLLEAWISWRAHVQLSHSMSSFSVIPNNYYDRLRVKCLNTLLRHYQETGDCKDLCLIENFIYAGILHRQASISGNGCLSTCMELSYGMFIHPRITGGRTTQK